MITNSYALPTAAAVLTARYVKTVLPPGPEACSPTGV